MTRAGQETGAVEETRAVNEPAVQEPSTSREPRAVD